MFASQKKNIYKYKYIILYYIILYIYIYIYIRVIFFSKNIQKAQITWYFLVSFYKNHQTAILEGTL